MQPIAHRDVIRPEAFAPPPAPVDDEDPTTFHLQLDAQVAELSHAFRARAKARRLLARLGLAVLTLVAGLLIAAALGVASHDAVAGGGGPMLIALVAGLTVIGALVACSLCALPPRERAWLDRALVAAVGTGGLALTAVIAALVQGVNVGVDLLAALAVALTMAALLWVVVRSPAIVQRPSTVALLTPRRDPWPAHDRPDRRALALQRVLAWSKAYATSRDRVRSAGESAAWFASPGALAIAAAVAAGADAMSATASASPADGSTIGASGLPILVNVLQFATAAGLVLVAWWIGATPVGADAGRRVQVTAPPRLAAIRVVLLAVLGTCGALALVGLSSPAAPTEALAPTWGHVYLVSILPAAAGLFVSARKLVVAVESWLPRPNPEDLIVGLTVPDAELRERALDALQTITGVERPDYNGSTAGVARWYTWLGDVALRRELVGREWPIVSRVTVPGPRGIA